MLEEVDEFWDVVKTQKPDTAHALEELVQIAAMCQRTDDLNLPHWSNGMIFLS